MIFWMRSINCLNVCVTLIILSVGLVCPKNANLTGPHIQKTHQGSHVSLKTWKTCEKIDQFSSPEKKLWKSKKKQNVLEVFCCPVKNISTIFFLRKNWWTICISKHPKTVTFAIWRGQVMFRIIIMFKSSLWTRVIWIGCLWLCYGNALNTLPIK